MSGDSHSSKGTVVGISLMVSTPPPPRREHHGEERERTPSVEDRVRKCIERIDNGCGTEVDFLTLKKLKAAIQSRKKITPRMKNILDMMEPTIQRFGYYY
jgi:hypothetical protein